MNVFGTLIGDAWYFWSGFFTWLPYGDLFAAAAAAGLLIGLGTVIGKVMNSTCR